MTNKLTLTDLTNLQNENVTITALTTNNTLIENAIEDTISRSGAIPNQMNAQLDMNSNAIINLPEAISDDSPVRKEEFDEAIDSISGTALSLSTSGIVVSLPSHTVTTRTLTGTANEVTVTDGSGVSGDPTISLPTALTFTGKTVTGGTLATPTITNPTVSTGTFTSPTLVTPALGTPASGVMTNVTGLPVSTGISGLGTGVATFLGTPSSANLASALTDETGTGAAVFANTPTLVSPILGTPTSGTLTNATGLPVTTGISGLGTGVATFLATPSSANLATALTDETGTGANVFANTPTLVSPILGTPTSGTLTNATGLPISTGVSGLGTGVATFLGTPSSANLFSAVTDETGSGSLVFANTPTLVSPILGTPTSGTLTNATGLPVSSGISGLGTGVATFLATPSSANLISALTDETGTGAAMFAASPTTTGTLTGAAANFSDTVTFGTGTVTALTNKASPDPTNDYTIIYDSAGTAIKKATVGSIGSAGSVASIAGNTGVFTLSNGITNSTNDIRLDLSSSGATTRALLYAAPFDALAYNGIQVNGSMEVSQENGTTSVSLTSSVAKYLVDGVYGYFTSASIVMAGQQVTPPGSPAFGAAHQKGVQLKSTTGAALGSGDRAFFEIPIEGYRVARCGFGNAAAQSVSIGFWVYATIAGTMTVSIKNVNADRTYLVNVAVNSATTWEYKTVTITGDTTGTWGLTTGVGFYVDLCFGAGSTFQGTNASWNAGNYNGTSSTTNFFASNNNLVAVTGLLVLPGIELPSSTRAPLIMRPFDQELVLCQRYWSKTYDYAAAPGATTSSGIVVGVSSGTSQRPFINWVFPARMRTSATISTWSPVTGAASKFADLSTSADVTSNVNNSGETMAVLYPSGTLLIGDAVSIHATANARL